MNLKYFLILFSITLTQPLENVQNIQISYLFPIGSGSHSTIYRAYSTLTLNTYAAKYIPLTNASGIDPDEELFILNELTLLNIPHITKLRFCQSTPRFVILGFDLFPTNLKIYANSLFSRGDEQLDKIIFQIFEAVAAVNNAGYGHFDIKSENILLDQQNNAYLSDFGYAYKATERVVRRAKVLGTLQYLPFEVRFGEYSIKADTYSLGVLLFELLADKALWRLFLFDKVNYFSELDEQFYLRKFKGCKWRKLASGIDYQSIAERFMLTTVTERKTVNDLLVQFVEPYREGIKDRSLEFK